MMRTEKLVDCCFALRLSARAQTATLFLLVVLICMLLGACSSAEKKAQNECQQIGFTPATKLYNDCLTVRMREGNTAYHGGHVSSSEGEQGR